MTELSLATPKSTAEPGRLRRLFRWLAGDFRAALAAPCTQPPGVTDAPRPELISPVS